MKARKSVWLMLFASKHGAHARRKDCPRPCMVWGIAMGRERRVLLNGAGEV